MRESSARIKQSRKPRRLAPIHEQSDQERWLLTYADMITLLTIFFLMLYSMSVMNSSRFARLASSVKSSLQPVESKEQTDRTPPDPAAVQRAIDQAKRYAQAMQELKEYVRTQQVADKMSIYDDSRGLVISLMADDLLFAKGQAEVRPTANVLLDKVASALKANANAIQIEGHTCDLPIRTDRFPSNWELSGGRASMILRYLTESSGLNPKRFSVAGYADTRPVKPNTSEANRASNRRVDIVIMKAEETKTNKIQEQ